MKNIFLFLIPVLFLNGCATPSGEHIFIDSNVSADVYTGDKKIGETPFYEVLTGKEIEHLSIRKKGYKTVILKTASVRMNKHYTLGGLFAVTQMPFSSTTGCEKIPMSVINKEQEDLCLVNSGYVLMTTVYGMGITTVLTDTFYWPSYAFEYEDNEYYVEMVPDGKNKFSEADKQYLKRNIFVLANFEMLRSGNKEYTEALRTLSANKEIPSAAEYARVTDYLRVINKKAYEN